MMAGKYGHESKAFNDGIPDEILSDVEMLEEDARMSVVDSCGDDLWLDQMVSDFLIEFPDFDISDYLDPELKSSLDNGVTDALHRIDHEIKQQDITFLSRDEDINELPCRPHCVNQMFEQNQKLIIELQNELESLRKIQSNLQISSMGKDLEVENTDEHSKNAELCVEDTPIDRRRSMKSTEEQNVGDKIISKESEDVLPNADAEHQLQSNDNFSFNDSFKKSASSHCQQRLRSKTGPTYELRNRKSSETKHKTKHGRKARMGLHYCNVCRRQFNSKSILVSHLRIHNGEKPYECKVCQKAFSVAFSLSQHLRIHSGEKPYKCSVCQKAFGQSSNLKRHLRIHSGKKQILNFNGLLPIIFFPPPFEEKPYKCTVCQKAFSVACSLSTHLRIHSGKKQILNFKGSLPIIFFLRRLEKSLTSVRSVKKHSLDQTICPHRGPHICAFILVRRQAFKLNDFLPVIISLSTFNIVSNVSVYLRTHSVCAPYLVISELMQQGTAVAEQRVTRVQNFNKFMNQIFNEKCLSTNRLCSTCI
ncbi:Zinc finger protein [Pseudolycoriella hygida]|uniref:Zinc finger protein n=1 Tax=Pseudolycoriella hygida TaxID=35572 RepID=A0A9Q0N8P9_9DIPT|nr:Zinc finger protein [Pseudolycoriella hygida]